jgi:hypothetical protein
MLNAFFWCFLLPTLSSLGILILVKMGLLPRHVRNHLDWIVLILPVFYSLYVLSFEVLAHIPSIFRRGGGASTLEHSFKEGEWRENISESMLKVVAASPDEWNWITASFKMDLQAMQYRTKYLTALAGAVFFLIMQGIDSLADGEEKVTWIRNSRLGWLETSTSNLAQFVGLGLFLMLLYLSGSQTYHSLKRYLDCAELINLRKSTQRKE